MKHKSELLQLSIVIPVYNRQEGLNELMLGLSKAVLLGGFEEQIEIIVIDDASDELVVLKDEFPFLVRLERNKENFGAPFSRGRGFQLSQAPFIHFHDSDDSISKRWLTEVIDELKCNQDLDLLMTGRLDLDKQGKKIRSQKYFHKQVHHSEKIQSRLVYRNCMGPLGGVFFSRRVLEKVTFKSFLSCQDWQMYIDAIEYAKVLRSRPDIHFVFDKTGDDRISHDARKKILGHSQLAKINIPKSRFKKSIRLFYLYTCKEHIFNQGGSILYFYRKNKIRIILTYLIISIYWRIT